MFTRFLKLPTQTNLFSAACGLLLLTACGGSDVPSDTSGTSPLISVSAEPAGSHCAAGGSKILAGIDTNSNGVLDSSEIASTAYSCTGMAGATSLVSVVTEAAGANCANGGSKLSIGLDTNTNGILDSTEITSSAYSCHSTTGSAGSSGLSSLLSIVAEPAGANCATGGNKIKVGLDANANGLLDSAEVASTSYSCNGTNGYNSLIKTTTLTAGSTCTYGGNQINVGLDSNANGSLDASEITSSTASCNGAPGATGAAGNNALVSIVAESAGSNCANGGSKVTAGADGNGNGTLDAAEVSSTGYVCNGSTGASGAAGSNGYNSLLSMSAEPAGANCATGGNKLSTGLDSNNNNTLDAAEITSTRYACNGSTGASGSTGLTSLVKVSSLGLGSSCTLGGSKIESGIDANGNSTLDTSEISSTAYACNGLTGAAGNNSLISTTTEAAGSNCRYGGQKLTAGVDANSNGTLESGEVSSTSYVCHGAGVSWVSVTDTTQQASANSGYLVNNDSTRPTITLPASASLSIGDTIEVSGLGSMGWKIAQNAGQSIITSALGNDAIIPAGKTWTAQTAAGNGDWRSIASSADGTKLVVADYSGNRLLTSIDSGVTWTARDSTRNWSSVASSADGMKLVAVVQLGQIYTSTDSGLTWTARESTRIWLSVASSADGTKLVAVAYNGQIYTSVDSGLTWTARESNRSWQTVASSADGTKLVAAEYGGQIYTSVDSGLTWTARESNRDWNTVASSADGMKLVAVVQNGQIYTSTDSGVTWIPRMTDADRSWASVASSADGVRLATAVTGGQIYTSVDAGVTWSARDSNRNWWPVAISADGTKLFAGVGCYNSGYLYSSLPLPAATTTNGTAGTLSGDQYEAVSLQYVGSGKFMVKSYVGTLEVE